MRIERIEVLGFRSIRDLLIVDLTTQPGLIHLQGKNMDEPRLGANGAGKTSLWEAVCWCLQGKTASGLKGTEVATWSGGQGVYVLVKVNGHKVLRTWGSNLLQLDGNDCTQDDIDAMLGVNYDSYLRSHYHGQHHPSFLDLGATAKTDLLASVLDLDVWSKHSKHAADSHDTALDVLAGLRERLAAARAAYAEADPTDLDAHAKAWEVSHARDVEDAVNAAIKFREHLAQLERPEAGSLARVRQRLERADEELDNAISARDALVDLRRAVDSEVAALRSVPEHQCFTCGQPVSAAHRASCIGRAAKKEREAPGVRDIEAAQEAVAAAKALRARRAGEVEYTAAQNAKLGVAVELAARDVEHAEKQLAALDARVNPYLEQIERARARRDKYSARIEHLGGSIATYERLTAKLKAWVQRFKDVRLFLVTEALTQLEIESNAALVTLGLEGWRITFAPDTETKSGTLKRGFTTLIESPTNPRPVPWTVWSGGEAQRLRLAADMGLTNLILSYTGSESFVEVWDEPSSGMSVEGVDDMVQAFKDRAQSLGKQIWLIDHRSLGSGAFDAVHVAVKQGGTTTLKELT